MPAVTPQEDRSVVLCSMDSSTMEFIVFAFLFHIFYVQKYNSVQFFLLFEFWFSG